MLRYRQDSMEGDAYNENKEEGARKAGKGGHRI